MPNELNLKMEKNLNVQSGMDQKVDIPRQYTIQKVLIGIYLGMTKNVIEFPNRIISNRNRNIFSKNFFILLISQCSVVVWAKMVEDRIKV